MDAFHHLLDLSMSISSCETDREALLEAHATLAAMNDERGVPASIWPSSLGKHERFFASPRVAA